MTAQTTFVLLATLATLLAMGIVLHPLLRSRGHHGRLAAPQANLVTLRAQAMALDAELARGEISIAEHLAARNELRARVLAEHASAGLAQAFSGPARGWATAIGIALPMMALPLYLTLGSPQMLTAPDTTPVRRGADASLTEVEVMVNQLAQQLQATEGSGVRDAAAWAMLARSLAALQRFEEADRAYQRATSLAPDDVDLLTDRADVLRMLPGAQPAAEADRLIARALAVAPGHLKALALAASAAFERRDTALAVSLWQRALKVAPPQGEFTRELTRNLEQARASLQTATTPMSPTTTGAGGSSVTAGARGNAAAVLRGRLEIAASLRERVHPDDTVFVVARAAQGPRMPLALAQFRVHDLPLTFTLDDRNAMVAGLSLSQYPDVVLSARISRTGSANPTPGDLIGQTAPVRTGAFGIVLRIDAIQP